MTKLPSYGIVHAVLCSAAALSVAKELSRTLANPFNGWAGSAGPKTRQFFSHLMYYVVKKINFLVRQGRVGAS